MLIEPAGYARCCEAIGGPARAWKHRRADMVMVGADDPVTTPAWQGFARRHIRRRPHRAVVVRSPRPNIERGDAVAGYLMAFPARQSETPQRG